MERHREKLVDVIECEFGLLDELLGMRALTYSHLEQIGCQLTRVKKNEMILDYIFKHEKHTDLIGALSKSCQSHVVNWIRGCGGKLC